MRKTSRWTTGENSILKQLNTPAKIQQYLNDTPYNPVIECKSPRYVMKKRTAHCFEGALFAAAALQFIGYEPLVVDMVAENDDDHVIAVFRYKNYWGAVAKSNCTTLRFREPIYRNIRELILSYFDLYCNVKGEKSLRSYTRPINVNWLHSPDWIISEEDLEPLGFKLSDYRHFPLLTRSQVKNLTPVDELLLQATLLGSNPKGLYKPGVKKDH